MQDQPVEDLQAEFRNLNLLQVIKNTNLTIMKEKTYYMEEKKDLID